MKPRKRKGTSNPGAADAEMVRLIDEKREFDEFRENTLPVLRQMVRDKKPPEEILRVVESLAAAKLGTMIVRDDKRSLAAIKEVLDRTQGKPIEKTETTHKFANLKREQAEALLKTKLGALKDDQPKTDADESSEPH
jgi:hypothetical protein